jgi:DNA-binding NtrC family response regulator
MKTQILIGDDKEKVRTSLARALGARGLETEAVNTPGEVITRARAKKYAVVITDLNYTHEGTEGYDVLRQLKDIPALKILYTGQMGFECAAEAFGLGADYIVLRKDESQLMEVLNTAIQEATKKVGEVK